MNNEMEIPKLVNKEDAEKIFHEACKKLDIDQKLINELSVYELTDGSRTSTDLDGWEAYFDGGMFVLRLFHIMSVLGAKNAYVLTTGEGHKKRENYNDIMKGLEKQIEVYSEYVRKHDMRLKFIANVPLLARLSKFMRALKRLEKESEKNRGLTVFVLINYSSDWAYRTGVLKKLPNANVIIKHTKGQVNEGLWLPGKLHNNGFVYVQNGSASRNWSDKQLVYFTAIALRSMILHRGQQYQKTYEKGEIEYIRKMREQRRVFVHRKLTAKPNKRVVMFSHLGPEIYEF